MNVLEGIRVLDFGKFVAGPWCAALLGDLGADVIKIEPVGGAEDRFIMPIAPDLGAMFAFCNRSKRGMTLNPTKPAGREVVGRLLKTADVVVVNVPPASRLSMGLDWDTVHAANPRTVLVTATGFGEEGPYRDRLGFDGVTQAMSSAAYASGWPDQPVKSLAPWTDYGTGYALAFSTMVALFARERTGLGQHVEGSLFRTSVTGMGREILEQGVLSSHRAPTLNRGQTSGPLDIFATSDGHIIVSVVGQRQFVRWCELMGEDHWLTDERFVDDVARGINTDILCERTQRWCSQYTTAEAMELLNEAQLPAGPCYTPQQVLDDPHVQATKMFAEVDYPGLARPAHLAQFPVVMTANPGFVRSRPPQVGEHTKLLMNELGYDDAQIAALREQRII